MNNYGIKSHCHHTPLSMWTCNRSNNLRSNLSSKMDTTISRTGCARRATLAVSAKSRWDAIDIPIDDMLIDAV